MAELVLLPNPQLEINLVDNDFADLTLTQGYGWDDDLSSLDSRGYFLGIYMRGEDGAFRGGDDHLGVYSSEQLPTPEGVDQYSLTITNRVAREVLNEDIGRGAIARARRRRDQDEIYVEVLLFGFVAVNAWDPITRTWDRRWIPQGDRMRSNTVGGIRF